VVIHHIGYDERRLVKGLSPLDELAAVVAAVDVPCAGRRRPAARRRSRARRTGAAGGARRAGDRRQRLQTERLDLGSILREICSESKTRWRRAPEQPVVAAPPRRARRPDQGARSENTAIFERRATQSDGMHRRRMQRNFHHGLL
jgi:hypothetical protein